MQLIQILPKCEHRQGSRCLLNSVNVKVDVARCTHILKCPAYFNCYETMFQSWHFDLKLRLTAKSQ